MRRALQRSGRRHHTARLLRDIGEPRCLVDRIADYRVLVATAAADVARRCLAGGHSYAELDFGARRVQPGTEFPRGGQRTAGIVVCRYGSAEDSQRGITLELVDQTAVTL